MTRLALAHVRADGAEHDLVDHLRAVGRLAAQFGEPFGGGAQAELAGLWHDLGKYAADFQAKLRAAQRLEAASAHLETDDEVAAHRKVDHSTAGALHAAQRDGGALLPIAFAIAGHHAGLADWGPLKERLGARQQRLEAALAGGAPRDLLDHPVPSLPSHLRPALRDVAAWHRLELFTRMVFSALCDADFLDTEAFFDAERPELRRGHLALPELAKRLRIHIDGLEARDTEVNRVRAEVRAACLAAATRSPGLFTLTVPTGGGKTLAAMEFGLRHALAHRLRRVIVAIPHTSIIEQNAQVYRRAFRLEDGDASLVEHHSSLDPARETPRGRVAAENWDAPIVVTTNVQLLESLFANRPSACRKLHHIARSVLVLDEAQTLPRDLLAPTTDMLEALTRDYGCSVVLCTATQPALGREVLGDCGFSATTEIIPDPHRLADRLRRVDTDWTMAGESVAWDALAKRLAEAEDVLAIVHRRDDARRLCAALDACLEDRSATHLSALMCPAHRHRVLEEIRARKGRGEPVRVVSTQLVEAGVDLDFPVVYRALAGLDSLAQAAGRCNREGRLAGRGTLHVFRAPTRPPEGILDQGLAVAEVMLAAGGLELDLFAPATHAAYFERLYRTGVDHDTKDIQGHRAKLDFRTVAEAYRLIDDDGSAPVVIPWDERARRAIAAVECLGPSRGRLRELQRVTVNVSKRDREAWVQAGEVRQAADGALHVLQHLGAYDARLGLVPGPVGTLAPGDAIV
jgi:CRISPR-associated endonuclease/helicase Cas3